MLAQHRMRRREDERFCARGFDLNTQTQGGLVRVRVAVFVSMLCRLLYSTNSNATRSSLCSPVFLSHLTNMPQINKNIFFEIEIETYFINVDKNSD